MSIQTKLEFYF